MKFTAVFIGLFALVSSAFAALETSSVDALVNGASDTLQFVPNQSSAFGLSGKTLGISGVCSVTGGSGPCTLPIEQLITSGSGALCKLVTIDIGPVDINVAGLDIKIPNGLDIAVTGTTGLLGQLLCALLGGSQGLLSALGLTQLLSLLGLLNTI